MRHQKKIHVLALTLLSVPAWTADVKAPAIRNFHQVNAHIYRGGQPAGDDWKSLAKLGVRTVIDLRRPSEHSIDEEARAVEAAGMRYVNVPMQGIVAPSDEQVSKVLALLDSDEPVFVHCKEGKDRTGAVIACYRMTRDRWQNKKAFDEAKSYGFHWFEVGMKSYIMNYRPPTQAAAVAGAQ